MNVLANNIDAKINVVYPVTMNVFIFDRPLCTMVVARSKLETGKLAYNTPLAISTGRYSIRATREFTIDYVFVFPESRPRSRLISIAI